MSLFDIRTRTNLRIAVICCSLLSAAVISCSKVKELTSGDESEKARALNKSVPTGMEHAEEDLGAKDPSAFLIIMIDSGQILLQDPDSQPIDIATLGLRVQESLGSKLPEQKVVYIAAAPDLPTSEVAAVIDELRRQRIETVKLLTSARDPEADKGGLFPTTPARPDRVFELRIQFEILNKGRPDPLVLAVRTRGERGQELNNEPFRNLERLAQRLQAIFNEREINRIFRENTNEVETTVFVSVSDDERDQEYGDLVKLVNAVRGAGASPIVLIESFRIPAGGGFTEEALRHPKENKTLPDVVSGGS